jgi:protein-S-isoprenylcysteine O-methyltransferase Ste14
MNMKKIAQYILYVWTALILIMSCSFFYNALLYGSEYTEWNLLGGIFSVLIVIAVWLGLFGLWFTLPEKKSEPASQPDKWTS